ncbi:hypothetical protein [Mannheimia indoligenes]|uniref:hypothetical protein n=1 Tax=Mannheimia indoligenes TaxID=3103145 RepID=UPI002FE6193F
MKNKLFGFILVFLLFFLCLSIVFTVFVVALDLFFYYFGELPMEYPEPEIYLRAAMASLLISIYYFWFISKYK